MPPTNQSSPRKNQPLVFIVVVLIIIVGIGLYVFLRAQVTGSSPLSWLQTSSSTSPVSNGPESDVRLSIKGTSVYTPSGAPIVLRGYSWGNWDTAQSQDAAENLSEGANMVRIPLSWYTSSDRSAGTDCGTATAGVKQESAQETKAQQDSYDPQAPGYINPSDLALVDQQIQWAVSQHLWVDLILRGGDCDFWTNPKIIPQYVAMWKFLAQRYKSTPYIGAYELLSEPHPQPPLTNAVVKDMYNQIITAIRTVDPTTPVIIGAASTYDIRNLEQVYLPNQSNVIYTADFYDPESYVLQAKKTSQLTGYPGTYQDEWKSGDSCTYTGEGQKVYVDKSYLATLLNCAVNFSKEHNVPFWVNQVGIRSITPGSMQYTEDALDLFRTDNFGFAYWTYRLEYRPDMVPAQSIGIVYQNADGSWSTKTNWMTMIDTFFKGGTTE